MSSSSLRGRQGELLVQPGGKVTLECIFSRKSGTPEWSWETSGREYPAGGSESLGIQMYFKSLLYSRVDRWGKDNRLELSDWATGCSRAGLWSCHVYKTFLIVSCKDTGRFTCTTPRGYTNSVKIVVTNLRCPELVGGNIEVTTSTTSTLIGSHVLLSCPPGYDLHGQNYVVCRDDGMVTNVCMLLIIVLPWKALGPQPFLPAFPYNVLH